MLPSNLYDSLKEIASAHRKIHRMMARTSDLYRASQTKLVAKVNALESQVPPAILELMVDYVIDGRQLVDNAILDDRSELSTVCLAGLYDSVKDVVSDYRHLHRMMMKHSDFYYTSHMQLAARLNELKSQVPSEILEFIMDVAIDKFQVLGNVVVMYLGD